MKFIFIAIFVLGFSSLGARTVDKNYLGIVGGILFHLPLDNMSIEEFIDRSIGYVPDDMVRDGLPHFGAKRDDWKSRKRLHKGYDIYIDHAKVLACADGKVIEVSDGKRSGKYIKIKHKNGIESLYIHLKDVFVKKNQYVKTAQVIGTVNGAVGNAIASQLHFEIKKDKVHQNPLTYIKKYYNLDIKLIRKIELYESWLQESIRYRDRLVSKFLLKN